MRKQRMLTSGLRFLNETFISVMARGAALYFPQQTSRLRADTVSANGTIRAMYLLLFFLVAATNFRGRDKEISPLTSHTFKLAASYEFISVPEGWRFIKKGTVNISYSVLSVDYHEFSDISTSASLFDEPLYQLDADIVQVFFSFWY